MNPIIATLFKRKSVRAYLERPIAPAERDLIIDAAIQAPTAGNQLLYTILDITDQSLKDQLAVSCDNQPFIAKAPLVLIFLADCRKWLDCYRYAGAAPREPAVGDFMLAASDALIAAQNAVVAAEALGIGSCYIGDILENCRHVRKLLQLDRYVVPVAMLVFGYPTEQQAKRPKPARFDRRFVVRQNGYAPLTKAEARAMFTEREAAEALEAGQPGFDYDSYLQAFCQRKYQSAFALEMNRSTAEYLAEFTSQPTGKGQA